MITEQYFNKLFDFLGSATLVEDQEEYIKQLEKDVVRWKEAHKRSVQVFNEDKVTIKNLEQLNRKVQAFFLASLLVNVVLALYTITLVG